MSKLLCLVDRGIPVSLLAKASEHKKCFGISDMKELTLKNIQDVVSFTRFTEYFQDKDGVLLRFVDEYATNRSKTPYLS